MTERTETVEPQGFDSIDDAEAAFLKRIRPEEEEEGQEEPQEAEEEPAEADEPEGTEDEPEAPEEPPGDPDEAIEHEVEVEGGEKRKVTLAHLKYLARQEAEFTKRQAAVAEAQTKAQADGERAVTALKALTERAQKEAAPYANIDFALAAVQLDEATYTQLRKDAEAAQESVKFHEQELEKLVGAQRQQQHEAYQTAARECVQALEKDIPGFGKDVYEEIGAYAESQGLPRAMFLGLTSAPAIKLIHKAMKADAAAKSAAAKVQKVIPKPKKTMAASSAPSGSVPGRTSEAKAIARLRETGSVDDAADAFLARMRSHTKD